MTKRLEAATFSWQSRAEGGQIKLRFAAEAYSMLTEGVDLKDGRLRAWYEREEENQKELRSKLSVGTQANYSIGFDGTS